MTFLMWGDRSAPKLVTALNPLPVLASFAGAMLDGSGILKVNPGLYRGTPTQSAKSVTTSSAQLLAANSNRSYLVIQNQDATNPMYINFGGTAAANNGSLKIPANGNYVAENGYIPTSAINAIASGGTVLVNTVEGS